MKTYKITADGMFQTGITEHEFNKLKNNPCKIVHLFEKTMNPTRYYEGLNGEPLVNPTIGQRLSTIITDGLIEEI